MFEINYIKNKNTNIPTTLEGITKIQNYIPLYKNFFQLSDSNFNNINLNNRYHVTHFEKNKQTCIEHTGKTCKKTTGNLENTRTYPPKQAKTNI